MNCETEATGTGGDVRESASRLPGAPPSALLSEASKVKSEPEGSVEHWWLPFESRETAVRNVRTPVWYSFPVGLPAAGSLFLTKQSFGHTELLSGRIAARTVFCSEWRCWLHSRMRISRFEQQHGLPREGNKIDSEETGLCPVWTCLPRGAVSPPSSGLQWSLRPANAAGAPRGTEKRESLKQNWF